VQPLRSTRALPPLKLVKFKEATPDSHTDLFTATVSLHFGSLVKPPHQWEFWSSRPGPQCPTSQYATSLTSRFGGATTSEAMKSNNTWAAGNVVVNVDVAVAVVVGGAVLLVVVDVTGSRGRSSRPTAPAAPAAASPAPALDPFAPLRVEFSCTDAPLASTLAACFPLSAPLGDLH